MNVLLILSSHIIVRLIKVRQQTQISSKCSSESKYTSSQLQTIRTIIREEGISALWKGLTSTAARQAWGLVLKFTMYNEIKGMLAGGKERIHELEPAQHMLAGGLANVVVGVLNSPPDVVKTRMQDTSAAYTSTWGTIYILIHLN